MTQYFENKQTGQIVKSSGTLDENWTKIDARVGKASEKQARQQKIDSFEQDLELKKLKRNLLNSRKNYLLSTNQDFLRSLEDNNYTLPRDVAIKRSTAYSEIDSIEAATTLAALNNFNEKF